jgi:hypothetical protein
VIASASMKKETEKGGNGLVEGISKNLGGIFRHLLPGVIIMGTAYVAHPCWFAWVDASSWSYLAILAVITLAVGNVWFTVNRYIIHQIIDWLLYRCGIKGPIPLTPKSQYREDLGEYVADFHFADIPDHARQHITFRASSVLLLYIISEVGGLFFFWHGSNPLFEQYKWLVCVTSILIFAAAIWQATLTRAIDSHVVDKGRAKAAENSAPDNIDEAIVVFLPKAKAGSDGD